MACVSSRRVGRTTRLFHFSRDRPNRGISYDVKFAVATKAELSEQYVLMWILRAGNPQIASPTGCKYALSLSLLAFKHEVMGFFSSRRPERFEEPLNNDASVVQVIRSRFVRLSAIRGPLCSMLISQTVR